MSLRLPAHLEKSHILDAEGNQYTSELKKSPSVIFGTREEELEYFQNLSSEANRIKKAISKIEKAFDGVPSQISTLKNVNSIFLSLFLAIFGVFLASLWGLNKDLSTLLERYNTVITTTNATKSAIEINSNDQRDLQEFRR